MARKRRVLRTQFKAKVAMAAAEGKKTLSESAGKSTRGPAARDVPNQFARRSGRQTPVSPNRHEFRNPGA